MYQSKTFVDFSKIMKNHNPTIVPLKQMFQGSCLGTPTEGIKLQYKLFVSNNTIPYLSVAIFTDAKSVRILIWRSICDINKNVISIFQ